MAFLDDLIGGLFGGGQQPKPQVRTQKQIRQAPARMYEDGSYQGDPRQLQRANPSMQFFEDNTFAQRPGLRSQQQIQSAPFKMYEDGSYQGDPRQFSQDNPGFRFYEDNSFSVPKASAPLTNDDPLAQLLKSLRY